MRELMREEIRATRDIRNFKRTGEELILACQVRSIIIPLLADHILREANLSGGYDQPVKRVM